MLFLSLSNLFSSVFTNTWFVHLLVCANVGCYFLGWKVESLRQDLYGFDGSTQDLMIWLIFCGLNTIFGTEGSQKTLTPQLTASLSKP